MDNVITMKVDGVTIEVDVEADTMICDISEDMDTIAPLLGWYGNLLAAAREWADMCDARYRAWRGRRVGSILASEGKLAEYKVNARINADPDFVHHKQTIAAAKRLVVRLQTAWDALDRKSSILQSKGALLRSEMRSHGMNTREEPEDKRGGGGGSPRRDRRTPEDRMADMSGRTKSHSNRRDSDSEE